MMPEIAAAGLILALVAALAYLLGSIPFGLVIARAMGLGDIRQIGSGSIGATNVLRTGNRTAAALTLLLDAGKGGIAVLLARALVGEDAAQLAAFASFVGHCYPVFLRFGGGKGIATALGILLALALPLGLAALAVWLAMAAVFRISSLAALVAAGATPILAAVLGYPEMAALCLLLAAIVVLRHRANIARLLAGEEPRIGQS